MSSYQGQYIFPPRTKATSGFYDRQSKNDSGKANGLALLTKTWMKMPQVWGQLKLNGNRNLIKVSPDRKIEFWNRHKELQQRYNMPDEMREEILRISPAGVWTVWDSELMNFKTKDIKDIVYLYDVLVWKGEWLEGSTYGQRYDILYQNVGPIHMSFDSTKHDKTLYLAKNYLPSEWEQVWDTIWQPGVHLDNSINWIEGLVVKRFDGVSRLEKGLQEYNNSGFMCRFRKPHKNYTS